MNIFEMVEEKTKIIDLETKEVGVVQSCLHAQFTVKFPTGAFTFFFYKDQNVTWKGE